MAQTPKLRVTQQGRLRIAQAQRDTKKIHTILAEMLKLWPNDTAIQNDEAYTRAPPIFFILPLPLPLNLKPEIRRRTGKKKTLNFQRSTLNAQLPTNSSEIEKLAEGLVRREPASLPHRTLLALALLKQHRPVAALDVYSNINVASNALSPSALAVHAAVLAANDHRDDARNEIQQVRLDQLLPEERALIQDF